MPEMKFKEIELYLTKFTVKDDEKGKFFDGYLSSPFLPKDIHIRIRKDDRGDYRALWIKRIRDYGNSGYSSSGPAPSGEDAPF